jgi:hypothetical protein
MRVKSPFYPTVRSSRRPRSGGNHAWQHLDRIVPYPAGILVPVPGQHITDNIVEFLVPYLRKQNKVELHGVVGQVCVPSILVLSTGDERHLVALVVARSSRRRAA